MLNGKDEKRDKEKPVGSHLDESSIKISIYNQKLKPYKYICFNFITFSSEKVLDLCKMGPPSFLSNVHVLRPSEPEKMVFANVSVCVSACLTVCV